MGSARYHLFLDTSPGFEGVITPEFEWLTKDPRVTIEYINVMEYLRSHGIHLPDNPTHFLPTATVRLWWRRLFLVSLAWKKFLTKVLPAIGKRIRALPHGVHDSDFGITAGHGFRQWRLKEDLSYRADLFRLLAPEFFPGKDVVWLDLDVAVTKDLSWLDTEGALVYRWGTYPFANNAFIYLPKSHAESRLRLVAHMNRLGSARPWTLFSEAACKDSGIEIVPVEGFDPPWEPSSFAFGDYEALFAESLDAAKNTQQLISNSRIVHWHNHWKTIPIPDSPIGMLTERYRSTQARRQAPNKKSG